MFKGFIERIVIFNPQTPHKFTSVQHPSVGSEATSIFRLCFALKSKVPPLCSYELHSQDPQSFRCGSQSDDDIRAGQPIVGSPHVSQRSLFQGQWSLE